MAKAGRIGIPNQLTGLSSWPKADECSTSQATARLLRRLYGSHRDMVHALRW